MKRLEWFFILCLALIIGTFVVRLVAVVGCAQQLTLWQCLAPTLHIVVPP